MEINKQLFEDILSGKLKGMFILRNRLTRNSAELIRTATTDRYESTHPYSIRNRSYTPSGLFLLYGESSDDIIDFIPNTDMKENELTIEIPDRKIVHVEHIGNKINVTFEDKKLVKIVKHYNDGSIEIEERM